MPPIGLLTAIPEEIAAFGAHLRQTREQSVAGIRFLHGALDGRAVVLAESGIGKVNAAIAATLLLDRFGCSGLIFSGVAGGLDPAFVVGDLVIAREVIQHDYGAIIKGELDVYRAGLLPFPEYRTGLAISPDPALLDALETAFAGAPSIRFGRILTGDSYLGCAETRERLFARFAAQAIDMETGAIAQVAAAFGRPWLAFRALSDLAGEDSRLDFNSFVHDSARKAAAAVLTALPAFSAL